MVTFACSFGTEQQGVSSARARQPIKHYTDMTKADIVSSITRQTGVEKAVVSTVVESFMDSIKDAMASHEHVYLRGFGSFIVKKRAEKVARDITKNTSITVPEHHRPAFKPAKDFTLSVKHKK